jgi:hypothetical protein
MKFVTVIASTLLSALAFGAPVAEPEASPQDNAISNWVPPPDQANEVYIKNVKTPNGSGCPKGTTVISMSDDHKIVQVTYSNFTALNGPNTNVLDTRKNCILTFDIGYPSNAFTFSLARFSESGFAIITDNGLSGSVSTSAQFPGFPGIMNWGFTIKGPFVGIYQKEVTAGVITYAPCGNGKSVLISINTQVYVQDSRTPKQKKANPDAFARLDVDEQNLRVTQLYKLVFRPCRK